MDAPRLVDGAGREVSDVEMMFGCPAGVDPDLFQWWMDTAYTDLARTAPKTEEYSGGGGGSADLRVMGDALAELCGMRDGPEAVKEELACWLYLLGKTSRLISDYKQGKPGKSDTLFDATIYTMMMRRLQAAGRWP